MGSEGHPVSKIPQSLFETDQFELVLSCNLCGSEDIEDVYPSTWVRRCRSCGFGFRSPRPTAGAITDFYSRPGKYSHWLSDMEGRDLCWRDRLARLRRFVRRGRILDVGAGIGEFLHHARPFFDIAGTEVSDEAVLVARERFGIELQTGTVEKARGLEPGSFDVVSLIHVLEHVPDPMRTIMRCKELLRPGGWLMIAVPNDSAMGWFKIHRGTLRTIRRIIASGPAIAYAETRPLESVDLRVAELDSEIHLSHFSPECLGRFLSRQGFRVVDVAPDPCYTTTGLRRMKDALDLRLWKWLYQASGVYAYETMSIMARRNQ